MKYLFVIALLGALLTVASTVSADEAAAKAAFEQGKELFNAERFAEAADAFRRAHELKPNWRLLYNIGQSEAAAKRYGLALQTFERYLASGGDDITAERRDEVLAELDRLRKMSGSVEIKAPEGARVVVDGMERGTTPLPGPLMVAAGVEHRLVIEGGEGTLLERSVLVSGEKTIVVEVEQLTEEAPSPATKPAEQPEEAPEPQPAPTEEESSGLKTGGWVALGLGGALLIGGAATGGAALSLNNKLVDNCNDQGECLPDQESDLNKRDALTTASTVLFGVGAAAAAAGIVMLLVDASGDGEGEVSARLIPAFSRELAGVAIEGRF